LKKKSVYLFEPNSEIYRRLIGIAPYYKIIDIPAGTYPFQENDVTSLCVMAVLVCKNDFNDKIAEKLLHAFFSRPQALKKFLRTDVRLNLMPVYEDLIPVKKGAEKFYKESFLYFKNTINKFLNYIFIFGIIFLFIYFSRRFKEFFFSERREIARIFLILSIIWIIGSIILYICEHKINENYENLFVAFWSCLINWFSFGQKEPYTFTGRITSTIMLVLGVGGIAWLTGEVASIFVHKKLLGGGRMIQKLNDHYVIINWNEKGYGIIKQLRHPEIKKRDILVITADNESIQKLLEGFDNVYHLNVPHISDIILKKGNVHRAHSVIILADFQNESAADAASVIIILAIRKICDENNVKQVPIVVEIIDPNKIELANFAGFLGRGYVEIVSSKYLGQGLMSQAAVNPGVTSIYKDLLGFGKGSMEIYGKEVTPNLIGLPYRDFCRKLLDLTEHGIHIIPIAISRQGKIYINPTYHQIEYLEENDIIFAITDSKEDLKKIEKL